MDHGQVALSSKLLRRSFRHPGSLLNQRSLPLSNKAPGMSALVGLYAAILLYVTVSQSELWPFSSYPMFSRPLCSERLTVYRLELEREDGSRELYRFPDPYEAIDFDREARHMLGRAVREGSSSVITAWLQIQARELSPTPTKARLVAFGFQHREEIHACELP